MTNKAKLKLLQGYVRTRPDTEHGKKVKSLTKSGFVRIRPNSLGIRHNGVCVSPEGISISCSDANPITPHITITVTSVWNSFTIGAVPSFQWNIGGFILPEGAKYINTQTAVLTIVNFTGADNQNYTCVATGKCGTDSQIINLHT